MYDFAQMIADYALAKSSGQVSREIIGRIMTDLFQKGNVDLLTRPVVSGMVMNGAGWNDIDDDEYATVYTLWYSRGSDVGSAMWTDDVILHVTPIKANGTVETPTHLDEYVDSLFAGTNNISSLLEADKTANGGKGLVLCAQRAQRGWSKAKSDADIYDEALHKLQAAYYLNDFSEYPTTEDLEVIADWYHIFEIYIKNFNDSAGQYTTNEELAYTIPMNPGEENAFLDPKVTGEMGKAGTFEFGMNPGHPFYESLCQMKTIFRIVYDGDTIFRGRVLTIDVSHMNGAKKIHCEGDLAFLLDSQIEGVSDNDRSKTNALPYMNELISSHNSQMIEGMSDKMFVLGEVPGTYSSAIESEQKANPDSDYRYGSGSWRDSQSAWNDLTNSFGGYIRTRYQNGTCYLDWLDQYYRSGVNPQVIEIGDNVIDLTSNSEVNNIFTAVIPVGSSNEGKNLYINGYQTSVHGNNNRILVPDICKVFSDAELNKGFHSKSDYEHAIDDYGIIYHTETFSNADTQAKLWEYATDWIKNNYIGGLYSFNVSALDMHIIGDSDGKFLVGDKVIIRYPDVDARNENPEAMITKTLTVMSITYDLYHPEKNTYKIGVPNAILKRNYGEKANKKTRAASSSGISTQIAEDEIRNKEKEIFEESRNLLEHEDIWSLVITKTEGSKEYEDYQKKYGDDAYAALLAVPEMILYDAQSDPGILGDQARKVVTGVLSGKDQRIELKGPPYNEEFIEESGKLMDAIIIDGINHGVTLYQKPLALSAIEYAQAKPALIFEAALSKPPAGYTTSSGKVTLYNESEGILGELENTVTTVMDGLRGAFDGQAFNLGEAVDVESFSASNIKAKIKASGLSSVLELGTGEGSTAIIEGQTGGDQKSGGFTFGTLIPSELEEEAKELVATIHGDGESGAQTLLKQKFGSDPLKGIVDVLNGEEEPTVEISGPDASAEFRTSKETDVEQPTTIKIMGDDNGDGKEWVGRKPNGEWRIKLNETVTYIGEDNKQHTTPGFVTAEDFKVASIPSFKTKLAVIDTLVTGYAEIGELKTAMATIDSLYAKQADIEGMLTATELFSGSTYTGSLNVSGSISASSNISGGLVTGNIQTGKITFLDNDDGYTDYYEQPVMVGSTSYGWVLANQTISLPDTIDATTIQEDTGLADGKIGFKFKTYGNPSAWQSVNFNIADTAYYKGHVGVNSATMPNNPTNDHDTFTGYGTNNYNTNLSYKYLRLKVPSKAGEDYDYYIGIDASGVLSEANIKASETYQNNVGINASETSLVSGERMDWMNWPIPAGERRELTNKYGKVTITGNDGSTYVFGINAETVWNEGVIEGESHADAQASYTEGYITGYQRAQSPAGDRTQAFVDQIYYNNNLSYNKNTEKLSLEVTGTSKVRYVKLQNGSMDPESDWSSDTVAGVPLTDDIEVSMKIVPTELYKESFDGTKFVVKSVGKTGEFSIGGETFDVPIKDFLEIPISAEIYPITTGFKWNTDGEHKFMYTFTTTGYVKSGGDTLYDLKQEENVLEPTFAINHGKNLMGVSVSRSDNIFTITPFEGGSKNTSIKITSGAGIAYNPSQHTYTPRGFAYLVDGAKTTLLHSSDDSPSGTEAYEAGKSAMGVSVSRSNNVFTITPLESASKSETITISSGTGISYNEETHTYTPKGFAYLVNGTNVTELHSGDGSPSGDEAYQAGLTKGRSEAQIVYGKITGISLRSVNGDQYTYNDTTNEYTVYLRASGTGLDPTDHPEGYKDGQVTVSGTLARNSVKVSSASVVMNEDTGYDKEARTATGSMIVSLDNGYSTILDNVSFDSIYQQGLDGGDEITEQEFEFDFVDDKGNAVTVDNPYFTVNNQAINDIYQRGVQDSQTVVTRYYAYVRVVNPQATVKRVPFKKKNNVSLNWGYLKENTEVILNSNTTTKINGTEYYSVWYDGFPGYIEKTYILTINTTSQGDKGGWSSVKPEPSIESVQITAIRHSNSSYQGRICVKANAYKGSVVEYNGEGVSESEYNSYAVSTNPVITNYLKALSSGYYLEHSSFRRDSEIEHKVFVTATYDTEKTEKVVLKLNSGAVSPKPTRNNVLGFYHRSTNYSSDISVSNMSMNSEPMEALDFVGLSITQGESIGTYISGNFNHSSFRLNSDLYHKVKLRVWYDFGEDRDVVVALTSTPKVPARKSFTITGLYHSSSVYASDIYVDGVNLTSNATFNYNNMVVTDGESATTYYSGSNSHSIFKYGSQLTHKLEVFVQYEFNESRTVIVEMTSGAKRPKLVSYDIGKVYNSSNLSIAVRLTDTLGYSLQPVCESSGYSSISTTDGEIASNYFTGAGKYAYYPGRASSMTCKIQVKNLVFQDGTNIAGPIVVSLAASMDPKPALVVKWVNYEIYHDPSDASSNFYSSLRPIYASSDGYYNEYVTSRSDSSASGFIRRWNTLSTASVSSYFRVVQAGYYITASVPSSTVSEIKHKIKVTVYKSNGFPQDDTTTEYLLKEGSSATIKCKNTSYVN